MKVFFGLSLRAADKLGEEYKAIYDTINKLGHEHMSDIAVSADSKEFYGMTKDEIKQMNLDLARKIHSSEVMIIEVTTHSLTMGYYLKMALDLNKPVILLHLPEKEPFYFSGLQNERLQIVEYTLTTLDIELRKALRYASEKIDIRFNLLLSPEMNNYLKWVSRKYDIQKSNFIRMLILEHKEKHTKEFEQEILKK